MKRSAQLLLASCVGCLTGAGIAAVVDGALVEISTNGFFTLLYGVCLLVIGFVLLWRVFSIKAAAGGVSSRLSKSLSFVFAAMVCVSGLVCVLLEKNWISISQSSKTPLYALLGTAMAFAWCFGIVDALNQGLCLCCCRCFFVNKKAFIRSFSNSPHQVYIILSAACAMGAMFGFLFGLLDVEDETNSLARYSEDQKISIPLGALIGAVTGFMNQRVYLSEPSRWA
mmetsp:Transcript_464/g.868  ORF Transcript_464/g.868 Transcript_464/m.868 type:complete len:226 (-) Transcript_464:1458-2135(-)